MGKPIISYKKNELYETFVDRYEVFENYYDFLVFLAVLGYHENTIKRNNYAGNRQKGTKGEIGLQNVYSNDIYRSIMACLAFHHTSDPEALVDSSVQMTTLAKYSAGGLAVAEEEFGDISGDPTDALINYLRENKSDEDDDIGGVLKDIVDSFDDEMMST